ncbi:DUF3237 domain-containing protein [Roseinatronobacter sp. S2]|uniref:DUF3237 domain-containing protein n=1 Tax=Roseinatronobacter sp. S2 TaxID=3035471 RepID=UPI00240FC6A8|nr:DUF3237 domain-containing protein [Roseinatronobacter sp. S2]WFE76618.1 DUF3237 domain-containing protein [Roseinatronobacter sp. S2]
MKDLSDETPIWLPNMTPQLEFAFATKVTVNPARNIGNLHGSGERLIMTVGGGTVAGPDIRGEILPGGTEWPLVRPDGVDSIDARYSFETDDGVLINIRNTGYRVIAPELRAQMKARVVDAGQYYFRTYSVFEAPVGKYDWLTRNVFIGFGERHPETLHLWYYKVL